MSPGNLFRSSRASMLRESLVSDGISARPPWIQRAPRLAFFGWVILVVLGLYLVRMGQLQVLEVGAWRERAKQQQSKLVTLSPSRGIIFDRNGKILVRNVPSYNVTVTPGLLPEDLERERAILMRLSQLLGDDDIPYSSVEVLDKPDYRNEFYGVGRTTYPPYGESPSPGLLEMVDEGRWLEPYEPIVVDQNVDRELALLIAQEGGLTMPGVGVEIVPRRSYPFGALISQVLGFLNPIPPEQIEAYRAKGYNENIDRIGAAGIEAQVEEYLRGTPGRKVVERDVLGQELNILSQLDPQAGDNVYLTLDTELQQVSEDALKAGMEAAHSQRGVVVALDPRNGQILAMVSLPTYDNNMFSKRLDEKAYQALTENPHLPLYNHAIADQVPSGSVFKIVPATAALNEGVINRYTTINCPGRILLVNKFAPDNPELAQPFVCWVYLQNGGGHGAETVVDALRDSCDVFFYEVGGGFEETEFEGLGVKRLAEYARLFGLGAVTNVDIPGELPGLVPAPTWKRQMYRETWTTGDTYNLSIGQGALQVTPLQMANALAVVANGGTLYQPQVIHHISDAEDNMIVPFTPKVIRTLNVPESVWQIVREGLDQAVSEQGTGQRARLDEIGINVAGKTGTAEYCDDIALKAGRCDVAEGKTLPTHAWFMAYAPFEAPELVVVVWVYDGGEGSVVSAPVAHDIMDFYFRRNLGLPPADAETGDGEATPGPGTPTPTP